MSFNVENIINRDGELWRLLSGWPKIELHRHLEGSLRLQTLVDIAHEYDIPLPTYNLDKLRPYVQITDDDEADFAVFLGKFTTLRQFYASLEIIRRITHEAIEDAARDNVRYMELRFTPHALGRLKQIPYDEVIAAVCEQAAESEKELPITVKLIISVNRHESEAIAGDVLDAALGAQNGTIVGMDLAGMEVGHSAVPFRPLFQRARAAGLHLTVHAGEWSGPENVREAVEVLNAERIGHGVRCIEDSDVVQLLRQRDITLEVCPTSNLHSGVYQRLVHHPLRDLDGLEVLTTINTDDPALSNITLTDEFALAHAGMGMSLHDLKRNVLNAARAAFLPDDERAGLVAWFEAALQHADDDTPAATTKPTPPKRNLKRPR